MIKLLNKLKSFGFVENPSLNIITPFNKFEPRYFTAEKNGVQIKTMISSGNIHKYQISVSFIPNPNDVRDILSMIEFDTIDELCFLLKSNSNIRYILSTF